MKPALLSPLLLAPLLAAGCATAEEEPFNPVQNVSYTALGQSPFWMVTIGDDSILLTLGPDSGRAEGQMSSYTYPRVLPRTADGVTRWESGEGNTVISVEARPGPCTGSKGRRYADRVTVSLSGRQMQGCGGRMLAGGRG